MRFKTTILLSGILLSLGAAVPAQVDPNASAETTAAAANVEELSKEQKEGVALAESAIIVYSGLQGKEKLMSVRKTAVEFGKMEVTNPDGSTSVAEYEQRIYRGDELEDEKFRLDLKFPSAQYALIWDSGNLFGLFNNATFTPREDAADTFRNRIVHGLNALLRYKEKGSTVELAGDEKLMGVDFYVLKLTDTEGRETRFFMSKKTLRIMMLEYEQKGVKFRRKFYNYNYAQLTLVPYRTVLWADGKQVEETRISTITFGQIVDESIFAKAEA